MKQVCIFFVTVLLLVLIPITAFSEKESTEEELIIWGTNYMPGNLIFSAALGYERGPDSSHCLTVYPGAEIIVFKPKIGAISPWDFGISAFGRFGLGFGGAGGGLCLGAGAFLNVHFGFRGLEFLYSKYVDPLDLFGSIGLIFDFLSYDAAGIGIATVSGLNYFLTDNLAVRATGNYWKVFGGDGFAGGSIGILFKIGPKQKVKALDYDFYIAFSQFSAFYWYTFAAGGFMFDDASYNEGEGTVWVVSSSSREEGEEYSVEKSLLKKNADGSKWWKVKYTDKDDSYVFEFLTDTEYIMRKFRYRSVNTQEIREWTPEDKDFESEDIIMSASIIREDEYAPWIVGKETLKVRAGSFKTDHIMHEYSADDYSWKYEWWISSDVPGKIVKFQWTNSEEDELWGELAEIIKNAGTELESF